MAGAKGEEKQLEVRAERFEGQVLQGFVEAIKGFGCVLKSLEDTE